MIHYKNMDKKIAEGPSKTKLEKTSTANAEVEEKAKQVPNISMRSAYPETVYHIFAVYTKHIKS